MFPGVQAMLDEARELWYEEQRSWQALINAKLYDAAECAWARRTAAESLTCILVTAL
jgi:hypothetical protein